MLYHSWHAVVPQSLPPHTPVMQPVFLLAKSYPAPPSRAALQFWSNNKQCPALLCLLQVESGRYHLYIGNACPWCHRVLLALIVRGLLPHISYTVAADDPERASRGGWVFDTPEPVFGCKDLRCCLRALHDLWHLNSDCICVIITSLVCGAAELSLRDCPLLTPA